MANELTIEINADDSGLQDGIGNIKQNLAIVGQGLMDLGSSIQDAFSNALQGVFDTQKGILKFQSQTGASNAEMKKYSSEIKDLYKSGWGESLEDVSSAMANVQQQSKQLGIQSSKDLKNISEMAIILRDNFEVDIPESTKTAGNLMKNFGMTSKESLDFIAKGFQEGLNQSDDLMDTLYEYSPQFSKIGLNANDMFAILKSGSESGIFTLDKIGDAIKEFGIRAMDGSTSSGDAFKSIGLNAEEMSQVFVKGGAEANNAFYKTVNGLAGIKDPVKQNAAGVALFGTMWEDLGAKTILAFADIDKGSVKYKGTMDKIKKSTASQDIENQFTSLKRVIEVDIVQPIASKLLPALKNIGNIAKEYLPKLKEIFDDIPGGVFVAIAGFAGLVSILLPIIGVIGTLIPAFEAVGAILGGFSMAMITPFLPIIAIIAGVIVAFIFFKDEIMSAFKSIYNFVIPIATTIWNFIKDTFIKNVMPIANTELPKLKAIFMQVWTGVKATIATVLPLIISLIKGLAPVFSGIGVVLGVVWNIFTLIFGNILSLVFNVFGNIFKIIGSIIKAIVGVVNITLGILGGDWKRVFDGLKQVATSIWNIIKSVFNVAINAIKTIVLNVMAIVVGIFGGNMNDLLSKAKQIWESIKQAFKTGINVAKDIISSIGTTITSTLSGLGKGIYNAGSRLIEQLVDGIRAGLGAVKKACKSVTDAISNFFPHSPAKEGALKTFPQVGGTLMQQLMDGIAASQSKLNGLTANVASDISGNINTSVNTNGNVNGQNNVVIPIYLDGKKISEVTAPYFVKSLRQQGF